MLKFTNSSGPEIHTQGCMKGYIDYAAGRQTRCQ